MFFSRRRSTWNQNRWSRSNRSRKNQRRYWLLMTLLLLVGTPIALEILIRAIAHFTGNSQQFAAGPSAQARRVEGYRLGFLSPDGQPYDGLSQGELRAVRSPLMGYQLVPKQQNQFWTINPQGFRDTNPVSTNKPSNEVRIFVLGGAMAFGQLSSTNETTFTNQLEKLLNDRVARQKSNTAQFQPAILPYRADQVEEVMKLPARIPDRQYRVVNAAVPGYATSNTLAKLMHQVANFNPDVVIILNSYEDLLLPGNQESVDIPGLDALTRGERDWVKAQITTPMQTWFKQLFLVQAVQKYALRSGPEKQILVPLNLLTVNSSELSNGLPADDKELGLRVDRYRNNLLRIAQWSGATKKRLMIGLQPEVSRRQDNVLTSEEKAILSELGSNYTSRMKQAYPKLVSATQQAIKAAPNARFLDLGGLYAKQPERVFQGPTSLTDEANRALAAKFFELIVREQAIVPKPYGS